MALLAAIKSFVVVANGSINIDATLQNLKGAILAEQEANVKLDSVIEQALDTVYDKLQTDIYPTPEVVAMASTTIVGSDLARMATVSEQIRDYLGRSARFQGERGRKGGLRRLSK